MTRHRWRKPSGRAAATCVKCGAKRKYVKRTRYYLAPAGWGGLGEFCWLKFPPPCIARVAP